MCIDRYMDDINRCFIADLGIFVGRDHLVGQDLLQGSLQLRKRADGASARCHQWLIYGLYMVNI